MEKIQIIIADDHPIVRDGLRQAIETDSEIEIVAETGGGNETLEKIRQFQPFVVVLDIDMPETDGFEIAQTIRAEKIKSEIIFLTVHREEYFMKKALSLGARGYVLKDSAVTDIVAAIKSAARGEPFISPAMLSYLVKPQFQNTKEGLSSLTPSERNVLKLIAQYKTTKEIAEMLFVSTRTVESHRMNICQKLHLRGTHSLMKFALEHLREINQE